MWINDEVAEGYENAPWLAEASCGEYFVIHALGVHPAHKGRGFARELVRKAAETARRRGMHALRLDVLSDNVPAIRLYESAGFRYISNMNLFYEDTGVAEFLLYELALSPDYI